MPAVYLHSKTSTFAINPRGDKQTEFDKKCVLMEIDAELADLAEDEVLQVQFARMKFEPVHFEEEPNEAN